MLIPDKKQLIELGQLIKQLAYFSSVVRLYYIWGIVSIDAKIVKRGSQCIGSAAELSLFLLG